MKIYFFPLIVLITILGCNKTKTSSTSEPDNEIAIGQIDSLYSEVLDEPRKIWVHTPLNAVPGKKYPVLYLLDGDGHFYSVVGLIKQLSTTNGNTTLPEMIVVGIPNTNRGRDLTPTEVKTDFFTGNPMAFPSGGGDRFLDFLEDELIPYIDNNYPTSPYRTYVGHSLGGLTTIHALVSRPHLFNNYISIDPSLWWDGMKYLEYADSVLSAGDFSGKQLFIGVANTMDAGMDTSRVQNDTSRSSTHIRSILKFAKSQEMRDNGLKFDWKYYGDDTHGSVPLITEYDGLRFLFSWYDLRDLNRIATAAMMDDGSFTIEESIKYIQSHYQKVTENMGYEVLPDEGLINQLGYFFMGENKLDWAAAFFDLNIQNFPGSGNVYDSRGDCYLAFGDSLKALESFKKSLEIADNDYTQPKIDSLEKYLNK